MSAATRTLGTGKITTSRDVVHGSGTLFKKEIKAGDAIEVGHPVTMTSEIRVVKMVVADGSLSINAPFSSDLSTGIPFFVLKKPQLLETSEMVQAAAAAKRREDEKAAVGQLTSEGGTSYTYRERKEGTFGSYRVVTVKLDATKSREELLEMRSKMKSDKFC